jgi:predicted acylesterase/phospholipase RssA
LLRVAKDTAPRNLFIIMQGQGGNSAFSAGVLQCLAERGDYRFVGFAGTSGGAKNATIAALGLMQGGRQGMIRHLQHYWRLLGKSGDGFLTSFNPVLNSFAIAKRMTFLTDRRYAADLLEKTEALFFTPEALAELREKGPYVGMNAVCSRSRREIYFGRRHIGSDTLRATAAHSSIFPDAQVGEKADAETGKIIFPGGPCRDGAEGGENPLGLQVLADFEREHPGIPYEVLVITLPDKSTEFTSAPFMRCAQD